MSFDPFGDYETAGYLRNIYQLTDLNHVKRLEHASFEANIEEALTYLAQLPTIDYSAILQVHQMLFLSVYPWAGQDRSALTPDLRITKGRTGEQGFTEFADAPDIRLAADYAFAQACKHERFRNRPGEVMGNLALAHPFLDGNGRTILLVYSELCYRAGFSIDWSQTTKEGYLAALSEEIFDPRRQVLDEYLKPCIVAAVKREEWPALIGGIQGLDGLEKEDLIYQRLNGSEPVQRYRGYLVKAIDEDKAP